ncbi:transcriptional regulator [[Haemophilus] felis]|uniref:Anti-sigma-E factor RseA n=1 Tax=[Haemophilus] felis TaxID=123822 RepID=A0A1T0B190_9PAST|nr:transcriptional regulator [[Haemophilus] felis]NBI41148.1 transcriptional regulator [[Haemophilus] felis]NBI43499.1 transcriptional regulator [[Haemophilus] felis]OOS03844.1 transcriptional regulator [[Haemophilus] felis]
MQKELLSAYIDGEQVNAEFTETLCQNEELQATWNNFHVIRSVMREESAVLLDADFTAKMEALIAAEELPPVAITQSQPLPQEVEDSPFMQKLKVMFMPLAQISVAASVCLVAVLGTQSVMVAKNSDQNLVQPQVLQTLPLNSEVQEVSYNAPVNDVITSEQMEKRSRKINAMLQDYEGQRRIHADSLLSADK